MKPGEINYWLRAVGMVLIVAGHATVDVRAATLEAKAQADTKIVASGKLRPFGRYLAPPHGNTVTVLPNGAVFIYGYGAPLHTWESQASQTDALRHRRELAREMRTYTEPKWWDPAARGWRKLPEAPECQAQEHYLHTATLVPNGKVLIAGGLCDRAKMGDDHEPHKAHTALSLWDSTSHQWLAAPSLNQARIYHTASLLPDGSVVIIGGEIDPALALDSDEAVLKSVEQFVAGKVTPLPPLTIARAKHTATPLRDGKILVAGGFDGAGKAIESAELWIPNTQTWRILPDMHTPRHSHSATQLSDGRVMIIGGVGPDGAPSSSVEIWDSQSEDWNVGPGLPTPLRGHAATLLASNQVLVAGGAWIASLGQSIPWAWTWNPTSDVWQVAGHTATVNERDLASEITLVSRPDDSAFVFTANDIMRWEPHTVGAASDVPQWQSRPSGVRLADGRLMLVGRPAGIGVSAQLVARIWDRVTDQWNDAGILNYDNESRASAIQIASGIVIYVTIDNEKILTCEKWDLTSNKWQDCGSAQIEYPNDWRVTLGLLADGRGFVVANRHEVLVYDETKNTWAPWRIEWSGEKLPLGAPIRPEQALAKIFDASKNQWQEINDAAARFTLSTNPFDWISLLWDAKAGWWTYYLPRKQMGADSQFLPDGCVISTNPLASFDPTTAKITQLKDPGFGMHPGGVEMIVLPDGTVTAAGGATRAKDPGIGFFHGRASCAGFASAAVDDQYINGELAVDVPIKAAAKTSAPPESGTSYWLDRVRQVFEGRRWLILACVLPLLGYLLLRRAGLGGARLGSPRVFRTMIYGLVLVFVVPVIWNYVKFHRATKETCADDPKLCLDSKSGILKPEKSAQGVATESTTIPCGMVGVWSSRQRGKNMRRIELKDDGTYAMEPSVVGADIATGYTGHWAVQGEKMIWRHNQGPSDLDVNPIVPESASRFTLIEENGSRTNYELIRAVQSKICTL